MRKDRTISIVSLLILAMFVFSVANVQGTQVARLVAPPPSAPHWTYGTGAAVRTVAVSADGKTIVAGSDDHCIYVFGSQDNTTIWKYKTGSIVCSVAVSDNGSTIVAGTAIGYVYAFGKADNTTLWTYMTGGAVDCVSISADGNTMVAGAQDKFIYVFNRSSGVPLWKYATGGIVLSVAVSADGNTIVEGGYGRYVHVFGRANNATLWQFQPKVGLTKLPVFAVAVSADGNTIAASADSSPYFKIYAFGRTDNSTLWVYNATSLTWGLAVSRDGTMIAIGGNDHYLRTFGRTNNATIISYNTTADIYRNIAISTDGSAIVCGNAAIIANQSKVLFFSKTLGYVGNCTIDQRIGRSTFMGGLSVGVSVNGTVSAYGGDAYGGDGGKIFVFRYNIPQASPTTDNSGLLTIIAITLGVAVVLAIVAVAFLMRRKSRATFRRK